MYQAKIAFINQPETRGIGEGKFENDGNTASFGIITVFKDEKFFEHYSFATNYRHNSDDWKSFARKNNIASGYSYDWWHDRQASGYNVTMQDETEFQAFREFWKG